MKPILTTTGSTAIHCVMVHRTYRHLTNLFTPWLHSRLRALASSIMDAHSSLSTAFCHHLYIFQLFQSRSSPFRTSLQFTLKYFLNCPSLIHSYYMSNPFESPLLISTAMSRFLYSSINSSLVVIFHIPCSTTGPCTLLDIFLSYMGLFISIPLTAQFHSTHYSWFHHWFTYLNFNCFTHGSRPKY